MRYLPRCLAVFVLLSYSSCLLSQVDLNKGLLAYYPFTGNANDISGNGNNGTLQNGVSLTTDRFGNANNAYYFDGIDDHIIVHDNGKLSASAISICAIVYPERGTAQSITGKIQRSTGYHATYHLGINYDVQSGFFYGVGPEFTPCNQQIPYNPSNPFTTSPWNFSANEWHCVVGTFQDSVIKIYVDGVLVDTKKYYFKNLDICTNTDFLIGRWWDGDPVPFKGKIDEVRVYDRALNQEEVHALCSTQECDQWLGLPMANAYAQSNEIDIPGNKLTIEARFNRTAPYTGGQTFAGDLVSKHQDPSNVNYLLRPNSAEITTTNGYFKTPDVCDIELNKTYHVAMTYDGVTLKFFRNGFLASQIAATGTLTQNNFRTRIGYYDGTLYPTSLIGYIDEVRIWNTVRSQSELKNFMNSLLPFPATQTGLLAYYTFDNLINKQGNAAYNLTLSAGAAINQTNPNCDFLPDSCGIIIDPTTVIADFTAPDTVCVNTPVNITNTSTNATSHYWNFCVADLNQTPQGANLGNIGNNLSQPVFMDFVQVNNNYYGFSVNFNQGHLIRHDFGNSLLNTPTSVDLGNFGNIIPPTNSAEGIQVVQNEGRWYAIIVGGYPSGNSPRIVRIDFGPNITNPAPAPYNWGNIGNLNQPIDLHVFKENNNWYGFTVNSEDNSITRFDFGTSFNNTPVGTNLGNIGNLQYPTGIFAINDNGNWRVFITNAGDNTRQTGTYSLTRLDFGNSLLNTPTGYNLGSLGNTLRHPRDLTIMKSCGQIIGFAVNGHLNNRSLVKLNFNNDLSSVPTATSLGNIGNMSFPHSLSKLFRVNEDIYSFVTNVDNNTLTRLRFTGCTNASISSFTGTNPPAITYDQPGTYNINLTVDEGLSTQTFTCKQVVVLPDAEFTYKQDVCDPYFVEFATPGNVTNVNWNVGDGTQNTGDTITHIYSAFGDYDIQLSYDGACPITEKATINMIKADVITTPDTVICDGSSKQLRTVPSTEFCWYPTTYLNDPSSPNPTTSTPQNITYYFTAKVQGVIQQDSVVIVIETPDVRTNNDTTICSESPVQLQSTGAVNYSWTPSAGISDINIPNPVAAPQNTTEYIVTGTTTHGCIDKDTVLISVNPLPTVTITQDTLTCFNSSIPLNATGGISYKWSPANGLDYTSIADPVARARTSTVYKVLVTDANNCSREDSVVITVRPYPEFTATSNHIICDGTILQLNAAGGDNYLWNPAPLISNPLSATPTTAPGTTTNYSVYINESTCGFDTTINFTIAVNPVPVLTVQKSNDANCNVPTAQLSVSGALAYVWSPAAPLDNPNSANPTAAVDSTTLFSVTGNNQFGCTTTEYITVKVDQTGIPRFVVPNAFTPNGDGKNDCFGIKRWGSTDITYFSVYNRWGQLLFETKDPSRCWDGTFNGKPQDAGGYVYIIHAKTICGFVKRQGVLTLVR